MKREIRYLSEVEYEVMVAHAERAYYRHIIGIGAFWLMVGFLLGRWT